MEKDEVTAMVNIIIIGDANVGKSNLLLRYIEDSFNDSLKPTIGADFYSKTKEIDGLTVNAKFWDTAGQEKYRAIGGRFYKEAHGILLVYDVSKKDTYTNLSRWATEVEDKSKRSVKVMLVGNKNDLLTSKEVSTEEGKQFAQEKKYFFFETSAKTGENVQQAFDVLIKEACQDVIKQERESELKEFKGIRDSLINIRSLPEEPKPKKKCC